MQVHFHCEVAHQRAFVRQAQFAETALHDLVEIARLMLADRNLLALMRHEGLTNLPAPLAERLAEGRRR